MTKVDFRILTMNFICKVCSYMIIASVKPFQKAEIVCDHCQTKYKVSVDLSYTMAKQEVKDGIK